MPAEAALRFRQIANLVVAGADRYNMRLSSWPPVARRPLRESPPQFFGAQRMNQQDPLPVEVHNLSRRFRTTMALDDVSLSVPRGCVFGLLGENGAGKTTFIRHLMGLYHAQTGSVRVFGHDPVKNPEQALGRVGYLSEDRDLPRWMRVGELMQYTQGFYPKWDANFAEELRNTFELDATQKIKTLSMGQTAKCGLLCALAHRPDLLILDEPSSGLDAVVRRHILSAAMRTVANEGRTVLFSSHLLDEVERVCDIVAIVASGKVLLHDSLENIKKSHFHVRVAFGTEYAQAPELPGVLSASGRGTSFTFLCDSAVSEFRAAVGHAGGTISEETTPSLEEIFVALVGQPELVHAHHRD